MAGITVYAFIFLVRVRSHATFLDSLTLFMYLRLMHCVVGELRCNILILSQVLNTNINDHRGSNYSGGVRQYIQAHLAPREEYRITGVRTDSYLDDMKNSIFCLAPEGTFTL